MCYVDLDYCEVWSETARMARKQHACDACGGTIKSSEAYLVHFSAYEGSVTHDKMCFRCWIVREQFAADHGQSFQPHMLTEMLASCVDEGDKDSLRWKLVLLNVQARGRRAKARLATTGGGL